MAASLTPSPPLYKFSRVKSYEGGIGAFATSSISMGTLILEEPPLMIANESTIHKVYNSASEGDKRKLFSLHDFRAIESSQEKSAIGVFNTNAYPTDPSKNEGGIFLDFARFNSSCTPNISHRYCTTAGNRQVFAARDIERGEELLNCYIEPYCDCQTRQDLYMEKFGFHCKCEVCCLPQSEQLISDNNRRLISELDDVIYNLVSKGKYEEGMKKIEERLALLAEENLDIPAMLCRVYYDAYQCCDHAGDVAAAAKFLKKVYQTQLLSDVDNSAECRNLKRLVESFS